MISRKDRMEIIWVGTRDGLRVWTDQGWQEEAYTWEGITTTPRVQVLIPDLEGGMWIGSSTGLIRWESGIITSKAIPGIPEHINILSLLEDQKNRLWVGTDLGLYMWDWETGSLTHFNRYQGELPNNTIYSLTEDVDGQIWIGTGSGGLIFSGEQFLAQSWGEENLDFKIRAIYPDHEGNMWLGTDGGGVLKVIQGVFQTISRKDGLKSNIAKSFLEDDAGRIWISSFDQGIDVYDQGEIVQHYDQQNGLGGSDISYSYKDSQGRLWFASYTGGLTRYDGKFTVFNESHGLASNQVFSMVELRPGKLLVGSDKGVNIIEGDRIIEHWDMEEGLPDNTIYALFIDKQDNIWMGSPTGVFRKKGDKITAYGLNEGIPEAVFSILQDPWGRLWFATSDGLYFYDSGQFIFVRISGAQGAHNVVSLTLEADSLMWIGTENGAYRLNLSNFRPDRNFQFEHYTRKDGLPSMECNANAAFTDSQGNIWLGTVVGASFHPVGIRPRRQIQKPSIHITGVRLGLEKTTWPSLGFQVEPFSEVPVGLHLPHRSNRLAFDYIGISLKSPRQVEYKFKLVGLDENWSPSTRSNSTYYSNLASGQYTFQVVAKSEAERWDYSDPAIFNFEIEPAYYETAWFWILVGTLLGIIGYNIYRNIASERKRKEEEIRIKNQAEKLQLEHQALYAMMNPHFTFNALQSIQYFIHSKDKISANKFLSSFAKLIRKNLESTKSEFISLQEEVDRLKLYLSLEQMRFPEKFTYEVTVDPSLDTQAIQIPPMIFQPFVENSIKHGIMPKGKDGKIEVRITSEGEEYLRVEVRDNGIGVEASKIKKANRPSEHVSKGMQITQDRLALFARMTGKKHSLDIREIRDNGHVEGTLVELVVPLETAV